MGTATTAQPSKARVVNYQRPWLYPKQLHAFFTTSRYSVIEASTKAGKTVGALAFIFEKALLGKKHQNWWWVAPVFGQAEIAYRRLKQGLSNEAREACRWNDTNQRVVVPSGGAIWFKSAEKPDGLYGEDVYGVVVDEASRTRREAWHALRSTLTATKGWGRFVGNVKGRKNWFYELARKAESGEPGMEYHKIVAGDAVMAGILSAGEIEQARRDLPESVFKELYLAEASDDGGNPFGIGAIQRCVVDRLSVARSVVRGIDLAKSVDWTVDIGLDATGVVAHFDRWQSPWRETIARIAGGPSCNGLVDSTGVGDPVLEEIQKACPNRFTGYKFDHTSKQKLMEGLALAIQGRKIMYPAGPIVNELESFEYEYTRTGVRYTAPQGQHDDCVVALALAWEQWGRNAGGWDEASYPTHQPRPYAQSETAWMG